MLQAKVKLKTTNPLYRVFLFHFPKCNVPYLYNLYNNVKVYKQQMQNGKISYFRNRYEQIQCGSTPTLDSSESDQKYFQIKIDTYHRVPFGVWYCCYQNPTLHVMILVLYLKWACLTGISGQLERASHCTTFSSTRS